MRKDQPRDSHGRFTKVTQDQEPLIIHMFNDPPYPGFGTWYSEVTITDPNLLDNGMSLIRRLEAEKGFTVKNEQPISDSKISVDNAQVQKDIPAAECHIEKKHEAVGYIAAALLGVLAGIAAAGGVFQIIRLLR